ncbi:MAG: hypothetical protein N3A72_04610 [bacterium]|nr:hypothetical protein [bacterium]
MFRRILKKLLLPNTNRDVIFLHIQCSHCGEKFIIRVNPKADLVAEPGKTPGACYTLHKEAMDNKCYRLIRIYLELDANYTIISQDIQGGQLINNH